MTISTSSCVRAGPGRHPDEREAHHEPGPSSEHQRHQRWNFACHAAPSAQDALDSPCERERRIDARPGQRAGLQPALEDRPQRGKERGRDGQAELRLQPLGAEQLFEGARPPS